MSLFGRDTHAAGGERGSAVAARVFNHLAVIGQAAGGQHLHLAAQFGDVAHGVAN